MAVTINTPVKFFYVASGDFIPPTLDDNTIYFFEGGSKITEEDILETPEIRIGSTKIANLTDIPDDYLTLASIQGQSDIIRNYLSIEDSPRWTEIST